jgi:hypothetical protein
MSHQQRTRAVPQSTTNTNTQTDNTEVINQISQIPPQTTNNPSEEIFFNGTDFTMLSNNSTDSLLMPAGCSVVSQFN